MKRQLKRCLLLLGLSVLLIAAGCQQGVAGATIKMAPPAVSPEITLPVFPTFELDITPKIVSPPLDLPPVPTVTITSFAKNEDRNLAPSTWTPPPPPTTFNPAPPPLPTTLPPETSGPVETKGPDQITGLSAEANGGDGIKLSWNRLQADDILCYKVYRSTSEGGPYNSIAAPAESTYINTGLEYNKTYYYCVSAVDVTQKEGNLSNEVSARPVPPTLASGTVPVLAGVFTWDG